MSKGGRNLILLGLIVIVFAALSTTFSLFLYHNSGDIYLDRSRPGFLPDEGEITADSDSYRFPESGTLTVEDLDEYNEHYNQRLEILDSFGEIFSSDPLSDEALGIPAAD